jgi:hypothetical protein
MKPKTTAARLTTAAVLLQILATRDAAAYIDPGSGSFFVQMLLAGILGAGMAIKAYWHRIKAFFGGGPASSPEAEPPEDEPHE